MKKNIYNYKFYLNKLEKLLYCLCQLCLFFIILFCRLVIEYLLYYNQLISKSSFSIIFFDNFIFAKFIFFNIIFYFISFAYILFIYL